MKTKEEKIEEEEEEEENSMDSESDSDVKGGKEATLKSHPQSQHSSSSSSSSDEDADDDNDDDDDEDEEEDESREAEELASLKVALTQNPNNYEGHVQYISKLRKHGALEELRQAREAMNALFPLSPSIWREWTQDEARLISRQEDLASVEALYERGVKDYLSIPLWLEYLEFVQEHDATVSQCTPQGLVKMRALFERALGAAGLHLSEGCKVWEAYRVFEQAVLLTILEDDVEMKSKQVDIVRSVFRRQLTVPLLNHSDTLREYREWEEELGTKVGDEADELAGLPPNIVSSYTKAFKVCSKYKSIEELIASGKPASAELLQNYQVYIALEEDMGDPARVQVIYERAIADFPVTFELWLKYTEYLDSNLKVPSIIKTVYARALQNCPWVGELWKRYLLALERCGAQEDEVFNVYEKSLQSGLQTHAEYLDLFQTRIDLLRRLFSKSGSNESEKQAALKKLRETFDNASQFLTTYFPGHVEQSLQFYQYWARLEFELGNNIQGARGVWENLIKSSGSMIEIWKDYVSMELALRNVKEARSLFKRCYSRKFEANGSEVICDEWLRFEREYGLLEDYDNALMKVRPRLAEIKKMQLAQEAKAVTFHSSEVTTQTATNADENSKEKEALLKENDRAAGKSKRKRGPDHKEYGTSTKRQKNKKEVTKETVIFVEDRYSDKQEMDSAANADKPVSETGHRAKDSKGSLKQQSYSDKCTAFVSNLPFEATEQQLHDFFSSCGHLKDVRMLRDRYTGRPRGIAYVEFENEESLSAAIQKNKQKLLGRPISIAQSNPDMGRSKVSNKGTARHGRGGASRLPNERTEETSHNKVDQPRGVSMMVGHRRGGHVKLTGSNTFAVPRKLVKPLGWGTSEQRPAEAGEDTPKSNEEFRKMLLGS